MRQQLAERDARIERRRARALGEPRADGGPLLLEPLGREEPLAGALDRGQATGELGRGEQPAGLQLFTGHRCVHDRADDRLRVAVLEQLEPGRVEAAGRRGVEHDTAADRRLGPQDDAVAAGGHDRLAQPQLGEAALADDAGGDVARADVDRDRGRYRLELLERDVESPADRIGAGLDEHVAAA